MTAKENSGEGLAYAKLLVLWGCTQLTLYGSVCKRPHDPDPDHCSGE